MDIHTHSYIYATALVIGAHDLLARTGLTQDMALCVHVAVCVCMHVCMHAHKHACMYACIQACMYTHTHTHTNTHTHTHTHIADAIGLLWVLAGLLS